MQRNKNDEPSISNECGAKSLNEATRQRQTDRQKCDNNVVVIGFIRDFQSILKKHIIIPNDIIKLIILFFTNKSLKLFIYENSKKVIGILDIENKKISKLIANTKWGRNGHGFCFVDNIKIPENVKLNGIDNTKLYDGLICMETHHKPIYRPNSCAAHSSIHQYPAIYLFEPNKINDDNDTINYYRFISSKQESLAKKFLFCGKYNGIVYQYNGNLYQSQLKNIDFETMNFNFKKIETYNIWQNSDYNQFKKVGMNNFQDFWKSIKNIKLSMIYLINKDKIFAMEKEDSWDSNAAKPIPKKKVVKCGLFDFKTSKWNESADLVKKEATHHKRGICHNQYNQHEIYTVNNEGEISQYNLTKNKWNVFKMYNSVKLIKNIRYTRANIVCWMDNNYILYSSNGDYFGYLDIRENQKKWNKINDITDLTTQFFKDNTSNMYNPQRSIFL